MTNTQLKRKLIFAKNQELLRLMKDMKLYQEYLLLALNDGIKCAFTGEDTPRQTISNMDYKRALSRYVDTYCLVLQARKEIKDLQEWECND